MKVILLLATLFGLSVAHAYEPQANNKVDKSPNANGILRNPTSQGTTTREGASFGPDPVLRDRSSSDEYADKSHTQNQAERPEHKKN